jgi:hypothetical protein
MPTGVWDRSKKKKIVASCSICNKCFSSHLQLALHVVVIHKITSEQYYCKFLRKSFGEGECARCGSPTRYIHMGAGYAKYCSYRCASLVSSQKKFETDLQRIRKVPKNAWKVCKLCNIHLCSIRALGVHLSVTHKISSKKYYDLYFKKSGEDVCKVCGEQTQYQSPSSGYSSCCSRKCGKSTEEARETMSKFRTGKPSPWKGKHLSYAHRRQIRLTLMKRAEKINKEQGLTFPFRGTKEVGFMDELQKISPYQIDLDFRPAGYILDGYIHELNLAIEFDEIATHAGLKAFQKDRRREVDIIHEIPKIQFWRVTEKQWDYYKGVVLENFQYMIEELKQLRDRLNKL